MSITLALARAGVDVVLVEAEPELALGASGTNSGILHTGFDSPPDTIECASSWPWPKRTRAR